MDIIFETRSTEGLTVTGNTIEGYAVVYNAPSQDLGGFTEIVAPGAVRDWLAGNPDIPMLFAHDFSKVLARTGSGTLKLAEDTKGLHYAFSIPNTTLGNDVREMVTRKDIPGASFRFKPPTSDEQSWNRRDGKTIRTLNRLTLREVSLTPFPAYLDSSAAIRSLHDWEQQQVNWKLRLLQKQAELMSW